MAESGGGRLAEDRSRRASTEEFENDYRHEEQDGYNFLTLSLVLLHCIVTSTHETLAKCI